MYQKPNLLDFLYALAGAAVSWWYARLYYTRGKDDSAALQARFDALHAVVQRALDQGIVTAERSATGQIIGLKAPTLS